ncbi:MAG: penicillin-binding protein 2 [Candidatus Andersenbacteria bacterium]|nr:penicillin-binding protein 2 [Candidatus Andersenbacteria bacterium]
MVGDDIIVPGRVPRRARATPRYVFLRWLLAVAVGAIMMRSFQLQIIQGERYQLQAEENRVVIIPRTAPRGIIYDKHRQALLANVASTDVFLDPRELPSEEDEAMIFDRLPSLIPIEPEGLREQVVLARTTKQPVMIYRGLGHDEVIALESISRDLPGVRLVSAAVRSYTYGQALAHVLGYTGQADQDELAARSDLLPGDVSGRAGIEKYYDAVLRGRAGAAFQEVDAAQRPQKELGELAAVPGTDLFLTIDGKLQQFIFSLLAEMAGAQDDSPPVAGSVVALDLRSGAVLALVSYPAFDPNVFSQPGLREGAAAVLHDEAQPLFNRATSGTYPPGSTIKPLLAAAGLAEQVITPQTTWLSSGGIRIGQWFFPDWKAGGHGLTNVTKALAESVNTFFYLLVGGDETRMGLSIDKAASYLTAFSLGSPTGIDLPGEEGGLVPTPAWKRQAKGEQWYIGDTYHLAIGQGDVLVTPLQMAVATAAIANGGTVFTPYIVDAQRTAGGKETRTTAEKRALDIADSHLAYVRAGMRAAVTEGSGRRLAGLAVPLAGKTGTAQVGGSELTHAWFTSFGPYDNPELVVTVLLEGAGEGDDVAVPLAEAIWRWWASNR